MTTLPLGEVKTHLSELVSRVHDHHERVTVTVHGRQPGQSLEIFSEACAQSQRAQIVTLDLVGPVQQVTRPSATVRWRPDRR